MPGLKPRSNQKHSNKKRKKNEPDPRDNFQTPPYATDLIVPYLPAGLVAWECASGNGRMAGRLIEKGFTVHLSDAYNPKAPLLLDFLVRNPEFSFDFIITNPPFSLKKEFFDRCIYYGVPFALLIPMDFSGWLLRAMRDHKARWLAPTRRINFETPTGRAGDDSKSYLHCGWLTVGMKLPQQVTVVELEIDEIVDPIGEKNGRNKTRKTGKIFKRRVPRKAQSRRKRKIRH